MDSLESDVCLLEDEIKELKEKIKLLHTNYTVALERKKKESTLLVAKLRKKLVEVEMKLASLDNVSSSCIETDLV